MAKAKSEAAHPTLPTHGASRLPSVDEGTGGRYRCLAAKRWAVLTIGTGLGNARFSMRSKKKPKD